MKVLICPLNWGLGHASRCIPIIHRLMAEGCEVSIAADSYPLELLKQEFPELSFIEYPSYPVQYAAGSSQIWPMIRCTPKIITKIFAEHRWLKKLLKTQKYDLVISDNRFGLWNKKIKSVYITHQLMVKMPKGLQFLESFIWRIHRFVISKYDECWIPDYDGETSPALSGDLAHKYPLLRNTRFIGPLSRFSLLKEVQPDKEYKYAAMLSGIEPQRTIFEKDLIERFKETPDKMLIIQGRPQSEKKARTFNNISIVSHLSTAEAASVLAGAEHIISRSGYSTIMDLAALGCLHKAELIPTPGQTEQQYLAEIHRN